MFSTECLGLECVIFTASNSIKIIKLPSLSGSCNKTSVWTSAVSVFLLGYFIWFAEEAVPAGEASRQEDRDEGGGDVSHPGGGKALRVLWALLSAAHSRKELPCQGDFLQPAEPQGCGQLCLCHRGLAWFVFSVFFGVIFTWGRPQERAAVLCSQHLWVKQGRISWYEES